MNTGLLKQVLNTDNGKIQFKLKGNQVPDVLFADVDWELVLIASRQ